MRQLRWHGDTGTLKPRSRCPVRIFIGALSTTLRPISARTCASATMPTGRDRRENNPPSGWVTSTAPAPLSTMFCAASSTASPPSSSGTGRITSPTRTSCRSLPVDGTSTSRPTVPTISPRLVTTSGRGGWPRIAVSTSARLSSGSHSAPSGAMMRSRSGIDGGSLELAGEVGGDLAGGEHPDRQLVLVHHQRGLPLALAHRREHVEQAGAPVAEQRRGGPGVARGHGGGAGAGPGRGGGGPGR